MEDFAGILRCPVTHSDLRWSNNRQSLGSVGGPAYGFTDGVVCLLRGEAGHVDATRVQAFYDGEGWQQDEQGQFGETRAFLDTRTTSFTFTRKCMTRLNKYFSAGGQYLLDAGSGPILHQEVLEYGAKFERRVCVDLSHLGLRAARSKIGDKGVYLQGDLTNLPIRSNSMDAVTCNHVIYQIPPDGQAAAFLELWRVLKPGGVAVVIYWWPYAPLARRLGRFVSLLTAMGAAASREATPIVEENASLPVLNHFPLSLAWFESQNWPFRYRIESFRVVDNAFMKTYISDDWRGRALLTMLYSLQVVAPSFCGKYGEMPAIIIHKD